MSADWKAGDKAVCISDNWNDKVTVNDCVPKKGHTYLVVGVVSGTNLCGQPDIGLFIAGCKSFHKIKRWVVFTGKGGELSFSHQNFRKLVPACDRAEIHEEATP